jgi:hypothetical protein
MRHRTMIFTLCLLASGTVWLTGCGEEKSKAVAPVPVTSVEQMNKEIALRLEQQKQDAEKASAAESEVAERTRFVQIIKTPLNQWASLFLQVNGKTLRETIEMGKSMQAYRTEIASVSTNACTPAARETLLKGIDNVSRIIGGIESSRGENVPPDIIEQFAAADALVKQGSRELNSCA